MNRDHGLHVVVFLAKKTQNGFYYTHYGTPGFGEDFAENENGVAVTNLVKEKFEESKSFLFLFFFFFFFSSSFYVYLQIFSLVLILSFFHVGENVNPLKVPMVTTVAIEL